MVPGVSRRRRIAARVIDLVVVFIAYAGAFAMAGLGYYVAIAVLIAGFVFPLVYESALRRTLGKTVMDLDIAGPDGAPGPRGLRLKRSVVTWTPFLLLIAGTLSTTEGVSAAFGMALFVYAVAVVVLILAKRPPPWDWLLGSNVVSLDSLSRSEPPSEVEPPRPARRRYTRSVRRR